jgi:hypothetical protein
MSYTPKPGSLTARMVDLVHRVAPYGGPVWVGTASLARECGIASSSVVTTMDQTPSKHGLVVRRRHGVHGVQYQAGPNSPQASSSGQPATEEESDPTDEEDPMLIPKQTIVSAADCHRPAGLVSSVFALGAAASGAVEKPEVAIPPARPKPEKARPAARTEAVFDAQRTRSFACAIWSDGRLALEVGGQPMVLRTGETRELLRYLSRMAEEAEHDGEKLSTA